MAAVKQRRRANGQALPPASKRQIQKYLSGELLPRDETFAKCAADALADGTRWEWIHGGTGPVTNTIQVMSTMQGTIRLGNIVTVTGMDPDERAAMFARLAQLTAKPIQQSRAGLAAFVDLWDRFIKSSPHEPKSDDQYRWAADLWSAIVAPLQVVGANPDDVPVSYYLGAIGALLAVVPAPGDGRDLSKRPKRH